MARVIRCGVSLGQEKVEYDFQLPNNWDNWSKQEQEEYIKNCEDLHAYRTVKKSRGEVVDE